MGSNDPENKPPQSTVCSLPLTQCTPAVHREAVCEECIECGICREECALLQKYGTPKSIADTFDLEDETCRKMAFGCSMCGLCTSVCPSGLHPGAMFLSCGGRFQSAEAHTTGNTPGFSATRSVAPPGFSPCMLSPRAATRFFSPAVPFRNSTDAVIKLFDHIRESVPTLGIVFDCCTKPSHDLGRQEHFQAMFGQMCSHLIQNAIRKILFACPSCHQVFREHADTFSVSTVYEFLAQKELPVTEKLSGAVSIQDSCTVRFEARIQEAVRTLVAQSGLRIEEMSHSRETTLCCGEGGAACFVAPDITDQWRSRRKQEAGEDPDRLLRRMHESPQSGHSDRAPA